MPRHATTRRPSAATPTLDLFPDEVDLELPFDEAEAETIGADVVRDTLVDALAHVLDALEGGAPIPANRLRAYRVLAGRPAVVDQPATPEQRRDEGIARAAARWTPEEEAAVDEAVAKVAADTLEHPYARAAQGLKPGEFTTADVWAELGEDFPVTKGIAGRMLAAKGAGIIANTGRTTIAPRESTGPNHGQRLTIWRAL